jgi:AcrR family transcriptional regulator
MSVDGQQADTAVRKILIGTMKALSRQGTQKLSVSDICEASHVARGTFYRYFNNKEEALSAVGRHFEEGIAAAIEAAIEANPDPVVRVEVVLDTLIAYRAAGGDLTRMLDVAPEFTLALIRDTFPNLVDVVTEALGPAAEESPLVTSGALTERQLGDLFVRSVMSMLLLPGSRSDEVRALVASLFSDPPAGKPKTKRRTNPGARRTRRSL